MRALKLLISVVSVLVGFRAGAGHPPGAAAHETAGNATSDGAGACTSSGRRAGSEARSAARDPI